MGDEGVIGDLGYIFNKIKDLGDPISIPADRQTVTTLNLNAPTFLQS